MVELEQEPDQWAMPPHHGKDIGAKPLKPLGGFLLS